MRGAELYVGGGGASSVSMESNVSASLDTMQQLTIRLLQDNENMKGCTLKLQMIF